MKKIRVKIRKIISFICIAGLSLFLTGCDAGGNNPVSTGLSEGPGYKIQLASSVEMVSVRGSSVITAQVFEPDGSPIRDGEKVLFATSEGGSLSDTEVETEGGKASITFTADDTPMRYENITASCRGATAVLQIWVLPQTF
jgi:hypothetical protein